MSKSIPLKWMDLMRSLEASPDLDWEERWLELKKYGESEEARISKAFDGV